ncbi:Stathmin like protein [Argiope bruennichi]|uniref:Stathmin n=1 Tax=Argiope bruennichi TaxID=94029 RepID=A0A8T0G3M7_ARGBR|nr:Stathmin like protein [Argiope bruennichi]
MDNESTEVRCSEHSKGGIKYELVLSEPVVESPKHVALSPPKSNLSIEDIEKKLKAAEERRQTTKVEEKRKGGNSPDREEKLEAIKRKLDTAQEQREAILNNLQDKLKEHDKHIAEVKKQMEEQTENLREKSIKKLELAQIKRESMLKEIQEKMKEHERHIEEVRQKAMSVNNDENCKENLSG